MTPLIKETYALDKSGDFYIFESEFDRWLEDKVKYSGSFESRENNYYLRPLSDEFIEFSISLTQTIVNINNKLTNTRYYNAWYEKP